MKITKRQLKRIIREGFLEDIFGKKVKSLNDVTTIGDLKKLIKYAQSAKRSELGKQAAKEWAKSSFWDETIGAIPGMSTAKNAGDVIRAMYNLPDTARTGTALDHMDIDDDVAKIVDDPIENAFLEALLGEIENMSDDAPINNLNVTKGLANYLEREFNARTVSGFSESRKKESIMKITKRQLRRIIKEELGDLDQHAGAITNKSLPAVDETSEEIGMSVNQLQAISATALELADMIKDLNHVPEWGDGKIATVLDRLNSIRSYMLGKAMGREE